MQLCLFFLFPRTNCGMCLYTVRRGKRNSGPGAVPSRHFVVPLRDWLGRPTPLEHCEERGAGRGGVGDGRVGKGGGEDRGAGVVACVAYIAGNDCVDVGIRGRVVGPRIAAALVVVLPR